MQPQKVPSAHLVFHDPVSQGKGCGAFEEHIGKVSALQALNVVLGMRFLVVLALL